MILKNKFQRLKKNKKKVHQKSLLFTGKTEKNCQKEKGEAKNTIGSCVGQDNSIICGLEEEKKNGNT